MRLLKRLDGRQLRRGHINNLLNPLFESLVFGCQHGRHGTRFLDAHFHRKSRLALATCFFLGRLERLDHDFVLRHLFREISLDTLQLERRH